MNPESRQASFVLDSVARAVANWTVERHAELDPQLPNRYGANWRADWLAHVTAQLHMLAQAIAVDSSEVFAHAVFWNRASFEARQGDHADLVQSLKCMREILTTELPKPVGQSAQQIVEIAIGSMKDDVPPPDWSAESDTAQQQRVLEYLQAVLEGDRLAAESMILATLEAGLTVAEIYEQVLTPAQVRLGNMWHRGEISVADEHAGSSTTQTVINRLRSHFHREPSNGRTVVATSTPGDLHEIGLRMVADLFELGGWNVVFLGANTPTDDILEILDRRRADLLALAISTALTLRDAAALIDTIRDNKAVAATRVLVGGPPFRAVPDLWRKLGADGCALSATQAVTLANQLTEP